MDKNETIVDAIDKIAGLYLQQSQGKNVDNELKKYKAELGAIHASWSDVQDAVQYVVNSYAQLLYSNSVADRGRWETVLRALETNRVLSKEVLASVHEQIDAINKEESSGNIVK